MLQETFSDLTEEEIKFIPTITSNHLLMFCTGAAQIPVTGFDSAPSISFVHDESKIVPSAQTCSNVLYLYVNETSINSPIHRCIVAALINVDFSQKYNFLINISYPNDAINAFG